MLLQGSTFAKPFFNDRCTRPSDISAKQAQDKLRDNTQASFETVVTTVITHQRQEDVQNSPLSCVLRTGIGAQRT